jgi:hypothetical protein
LLNGSAQDCGSGVLPGKVGKARCKSHPQKRAFHFSALPFVRLVCWHTFLPLSDGRQPAIPLPKCRMIGTILVRQRSLLS